MARHHAQGVVDMAVDYWFVEEINEDPEQWAVVIRFSDSQPGGQHSGPIGGSWMLAEQVEGMTLSEIRSNYGVPDGQLPGPYGSMTDAGGYNDMANVTVGWIYRSNIGDPGAAIMRPAIPWPPGVSPAEIRSPGGHPEVLLTRDAMTVVRAMRTYPSSAFFEE